MQFGAHLPLIDFVGKPWTLRRLLDYADQARSLGFSALSANDHLVFSRPWLDGLVALSAVLERSEGMMLATTVAVPAIRGPVPFAKAAAAIDILSGGRLMIGVGPGSSARDYEAVGLSFDERWKRLDEAVGVLRSLLGSDASDYSGQFYNTSGVVLEPKPLQRPGLPIWIGSWGSDAGLRRVARLADGWLASAYNTTPQLFAEASASLRARLLKEDKDPESFPRALATMFFYITDDASRRSSILNDVLAKTMNRDPEELGARLLVGSAEECASKLRAYDEAGLDSVFLWPVDDELDQLELFMRRVAPLV